MMELPQKSKMHQAMVMRDVDYDGLFFVAVRTTGVFCRPSCSARKPNVENVEYFSSSKEALLAGYRPCKRCRPMDSNGRPPLWVEQLLARIEQEPTGRIRDATLRGLGIDPSRARRYFNKCYGMTFQAYQRSRRMGLALAEVRRKKGLSGVGVRYGYESESGFREAFGKVFGTSPGRARSQDCLLTTWITSPIGALLAAASEQGLCLLEFTDRRGLERQINVLRLRFKMAIVPGINRHLEQVQEELDRYFDGRVTEFRTPLHITGTPFQESVWTQLRNIPYGQTRSYEQIARAIGRDRAWRAVARANGDNRVAILVPCHRVIRADGTLSGYGGGVWRKQHLLELERRPRLLSTGDDRPSPDQTSQKKKSPVNSRISASRTSMSDPCSSVTTI